MDNTFLKKKMKKQQKKKKTLELVNLIEISFFFGRIPMRMYLEQELLCGGSSSEQVAQLQASFARFNLYNSNPFQLSR